jgi:GNAT superfamily N-acetyltransferase
VLKAKKMPPSKSLASAAKLRGIALLYAHESATSLGTEADEQALWRKSVSWGVNPMPNRIVAVQLDKNDQPTPDVLGASYYNAEIGFISAIAVDPAHRRKGIGKLLIAASVDDMCNSLNPQLRQSTLHVLGCDATPGTHKLYCDICGYRPVSGDANKAATHGGDYSLDLRDDAFRQQYADLVMQ